MLKSITVEEMLHAGLAANMLTAIGGIVPFYDSKAMPKYVMCCQFLPSQINARFGFCPVSES